MTPASARARVFSIDDDVDPIEYCYEQAWTDGLPVVPPLPEKVALAVEATGRAPEDLVCSYPERGRTVLVEHVAANAVMAGCRPEYTPVVVAILEAMASEPFGIHMCNASTGGAAVAFVVNGPVRSALGMNWRGNVFGPGNRANSTIGRAVRLVQMNGFGSVPGAGNEAAMGGDTRPVLDRSTMGQPAKYAGYHIVENEDDFPSLQPLHVERGYRRDQNVVTVFSALGHLPIFVHQERTAQQIADSISHDLVHSGRLNQRFSLLLVIPPENAEIFARDGWSKADIRRAIFEGTSRSVAWMKENGWPSVGGVTDRSGRAVMRGSDVSAGDEDVEVAIAGAADDILVVVAGGPAGAFVHAVLQLEGAAVSREIHLPKGPQ